MSINHYANPEINPLLDAYVKDIDVHALEFDTLSVEDIDVSDTTKAGLTFVSFGVTVFDSNSLSTDKDIQSQSINTVSLETGSMTIDNQLSCSDINAEKGINNPKNIFLDEVVEIVGQGYIIGFKNVIYNQLPQYDSFWRYMKTYNTQTIIDNILKPVTTIRLNIYATSLATVPTSPIDFGFTIYDPDIFSNISCKIISLEGSCSNIYDLDDIATVGPVRWNTSIKKCTISSGQIEVLYGDVNPGLYPASKPIYFILDISYTTN